jgi:hypothetical protein
MWGLVKPFLDGKGKGNGKGSYSTQRQVSDFRLNTSRYLTDRDAACRHGATRGAYAHLGRYMDLIWRIFRLRFAARERH